MKQFSIHRLIFTALISVTFSTTFALERVESEVTEFEGIRKDNIVDLAILFPALRPRDLLNFQFENLIGPDEKMKIGPISVDVPGNFYIPKQKENYGILPITLKKERAGFYQEKGSREEAMAIWASGPFSNIIKAIQDDTPYTRLIPLLKIRKFSHNSLRDWTKTSKLTAPLRYDFLNRMDYSWKRDLRPQNHTDFVLGFQETPANRWSVTELHSKKEVHGKIRGGTPFHDAFKVFFMRIKDDNDLSSMTGYIRAGERGDHIRVEGAPPKLSGIVTAEDHVRWDPIDIPGWMAVVHQIKSSKNRFMGLEILSSDFGLSPLLNNNWHHQWVDPSLGRAELIQNKKKNESIAFFFVGSDREVPSPEEGDETPELFYHATEVRIANVK